MPSLYRYSINDDFKSCHCVSFSLLLIQCTGMRQGCVAAISYRKVFVSNYWKIDFVKSLVSVSNWYAIQLEHHEYMLKSSLHGIYTGWQGWFQQLIMFNVML